VQNQHNLSGLLVENDDSTAEELHSLQVQARARCGHITDLNACLTGLGPERCILLSDLFRFLQPKFVLLLFYALFFFSAFTFLQGKAVGFATILALGGWRQSARL